MARAVCLGFVLWSAAAAAARPVPPTDGEVAALQQNWQDEKTVASLLDWADGERERGQCARADKLYRKAFYSDDITDEERYRAQIGYERCEDPFHPRKPSEQLTLTKRVGVKKAKHVRPKVVPEVQEYEEESSDPYLAWKIAGYSTAGVTVAVAAVKLASENPEGKSFVLNSTTGVIAVGAVLTGAFLWRGYSGISMAPVVTGSSGGVAASVSF